jgi:hypothetical protein
VWFEPRVRIHNPFIDLRISTAPEYPKDRAVNNPAYRPTKSLGVFARSASAPPPCQRDCVGHQEQLLSPGVMDVGHLAVEEDPNAKKVSPITLDGNIQAQTMNVECYRDLCLKGKIAVSNSSSSTLKAATVTFAGEMIWKGLMKVKASKSVVMEAKSTFVSGSKRKGDAFEMTVDTPNFTNHSKLALKHLTLETPGISINNHGQMNVALKVPVVLGRFVNHKTGSVVIQNAVNLEFSDLFYNYGQLEFREDSSLKVAEKQPATKDKDGVWNSKVWVDGTVKVHKKLTLHTPVFCFLGKSKLLGEFKFHSELGFFQKGQHYVDAISGCAEKFLKIAKDTAVNAKAIELRKGRLIDEGSLSAKRIKVADSRVESSGKMRADSLDVSFSDSFDARVQIRERVTEPGDRYLAPAKEVSSTVLELPQKEVVAYQEKRRREIEEYNGLQSNLRDPKAAVGTRKKRTISFETEVMRDVKLSGDTHISKANIQAHSMSIEKAQIGVGIFKGIHVTLGANEIGALSVDASRVNVLTRTRLQVTTASLNISNSFEIGQGAKVQGRGQGDCAASNVTVNLSQGGTLRNQGDLVSETMVLQGLRPILRGKVENEGRIMAESLTLSNLNSAANQGATSAMHATVAHINHVISFTTNGRIAFKSVGSFQNSTVDQPIVISGPYAAKPGEDLSRFKFLDTLTIDVGDKGYKLENVTAKRIIINCSSLSVGKGVCTENLDITATSTVQFEKGVTFDQIGTIKLTAMNLNINGIVKVQRLTGSIAANISVAVGASLTCEDLDVGANGKSVDFINEGFITTTKSLRLKNIRLLNRATARIQTAHNLIGAELGVKGISNDGTIEVGGDVKLHNVPYEASKTSGTLTASKTVDLQFIQTPSSLGSIKADVISIKVSIGVARGGFSARQISIEAPAIHIQKPTQASERISFTTPTLNVSAAVSTPTLNVSSPTAAGKVTVDKTGSITTRAYSGD